ncbi:MAG TPA: GAF and ANTAR domain-containing protein [Ornithinibacter sp.]|nr:GAF and ANTAR domain-containing protein [Ornithinibacter sp.]
MPANGSADLLAIAEALRVVAGRSRGEGGRPPLEELVVATREQIPSASAVSVTALRGGRFRTEASTDEVALRADALQYEIGSGPCVDAVIDDSIYITQDVVLDERWAQWGRRVSSEVGVRSVLAYRLANLDDADTIAALNVYSHQVGAFDDRDLGAGLVLATHGSLLVTAQLAREKADNLLKALESNREIGVAMGILMHRHRLDRDQAFAVLRVASQDSNRKLADVASEVADTGILAIRRWPVSAGEPPVRP